MSLVVLKGDIFDSPCNVLVNPTNCIGPMGAGLAKQFRDRYPGLESRYREFCNNGDIKPGILSLYPINYDLRILNFPTKDNWRDNSKFEFIEVGLDKFIQTYKKRGITSIAFPLLGSGLGGLNKKMIREYMKVRLEPLSDIYIEIYSN